MPSRGPDVWVLRVKEELGLGDTCGQARKRVEPRLPKTGPNELRKRWVTAVLEPARFCALVDQAIEKNTTKDAALAALAGLKDPAVARVHHLLGERDGAHINALEARWKARVEPQSKERASAIESTVVVNGTVGMSVEMGHAFMAAERALPSIEKTGVTRNMVRWTDQGAEGNRVALTNTIAPRLSQQAQALLQDAATSDVSAYLAFYASDAGKALALLRVHVMRDALRAGMDRWLATLVADPKQKLRAFFAWPLFRRPACPDMEGCRKQCESGQAEACQALGVSLRTGRAGPVDLVGALEMFTRGCALKLATSCTEQASLTNQLTPASGHAPQARALLEHACKEGEPYACAALRATAVQEAALAADRPGLVRALQDAAAQCEGNHAPVCTLAAWQYAEGVEVPPDPARADALLAHGCKHGDMGSCRQWADDLYFGWGTVQPDHATAHVRYAQLCEEQQDLHACNNWGDMLEWGRGAPKDLVRARELYQRACDHGTGSGCWSLGTLHQHGIGVPKDLMEAARLLDRGCRLGVTPACSALEDLRHPKDEKEAP